MDTVCSFAARDRSDGDHHLARLQSRRLAPRERRIRRGWGIRRPVRRAEPPVHHPLGQCRAHRRARAARHLLAGLARARRRSPLRHLEARVPMGCEDGRRARPDGDTRRGLARAVRLLLRWPSRDGDEGRHGRSRRGNAPTAPAVPRRRGGYGVQARRGPRRVRGAGRLGAPARPADRHAAHGRRPPRGTGRRDAVQLPRRPARRGGRGRTPDRVGHAAGGRRRDARGARDRARPGPRRQSRGRATPARSPAARLRERSGRACCPTGTTTPPADPAPSPA